MFTDSSSIPAKKKAARRFFPDVIDLAVFAIGHATLHRDSPLAIAHDDSGVLYRKKIVGTVS